MKGQTQVFAVIMTEPGQGDSPITVKEVVRDQQTAESEVARLNEINKDKGCHYSWQATRMKGGVQKEQDMIVCRHCGQLRPYPTQPGLWEYLEDPRFNEDGSLMTECTSIEITSQIVNGEHGSDLEKRKVVKVDQPWQKANIVDSSSLGEDYSILFVPAGKKHAEWWPERALWRKIGDTPEIKWQDVICEGNRLGDGKWMGKYDRMRMEKHEA